MQLSAGTITPPKAIGCQSTIGWLGTLELSGLLIRQHAANSVEKLLSNMLEGVFRGSPTINRVTIVDPGAF